MPPRRQLENPETVAARRQRAERVDPNAGRPELLGVDDFRPNEDMY